jgi:Leucine-rich repeat (LRR) protein
MQREDIDKVLKRSEPESISFCQKELTSECLVTIIEAILAYPNQDGSKKFQNLLCLNLDQNLIKSIPESISSLKNLKELILSQNKIAFLPDAIGDFENLAKLDLKCNKLTRFPQVFSNLKSLRELNLSNNPLYSIPDIILELENLDKLAIDSSPLQCIPDTIIKMKNLKELSLYNCSITTLPDSICNLNNLTELDLRYNLLRSLPDAIGNLNNLTDLYLRNNQLQLLPDSIGNLKNIRELYLFNNRLQSLPNSIGNLNNLRVLFLLNNRLQSLPNSIGYLNNLRVLFLLNNRLQSLPNSIGYLNNLRAINLQNNNLISLPPCFRDIIGKLGLLVLSGNRNFSEYGEGEYLGRFELAELFGDRLVFEDAKKPKGIVNEVEYINSMKKTPIYWNIEKLGNIKFKQIQETELTSFQMINISCYLQEKEVLSEEESFILKEYIQSLFDPNYEYKRWRMLQKYVSVTKNYLGFILSYLQEKVSSQRMDLVSFSVSDIIEGIKFCPDRQICELKGAYCAILNDNESDLDEIIYQNIAKQKEQIFNLAITPSISPQNVHVLSYWKYELRDKLGFDFEFKTDIGTLGQDPFRGHRGNALQAFFTKFTVNYVISNLNAHINDNKPAMCELMLMISQDENLTEEDKEEMGVNLEGDKFTNINEKTVEYILIKKDIVRKGEPDKGEREFSLSYE